MLSATEKLSINSENIDLLERQVETDSIRLDKGEISLSDFAQSESALAGAQAKFIEANNEVTISKLNYENIIGNINDIDTLKKSFNAITQVPETLDAATQLSQKKS